LIGTSASDDTITAGNGNDTVMLGGGDDSLRLGTGDDTMALGSGHDTVTVGSGNDLFVIGHGDYNANGTVTGTGNDTIQFNGTAGDSLVLNGGSADLHVGGTFASLTVDATGASNGIAVDATALTHSVTLLGNGGDDTLIGTSGSNDTITALGGANSVIGGTGNDSITVGTGNDTITVGNGSDTIVAGGGTDTITIGATSDTSGGTSAITIGADTTVVYQSALDSTASNLNEIFGFMDGASGTILDTSAIGSMTTLATPHADTWQGSIAATFSGDSPNTLNYAYDSGANVTYVHLETTGYSANDLVVELQGNHVVTAANFHGHP